jgi:hypothetical protein
MFFLIKNNTPLINTLSRVDLDLTKPDFDSFIYEDIYGWLAYETAYLFNNVS